MNGQPLSLAVCIPVWNRGDLLRVSFDSLCRALQGIDATLYIFDNGSDRETAEIIHRLSSNGPRLVKVFFGQNRGIPYAVNCFLRLIAEGCEVEKITPPGFVMLMDADVYFKQPIEPYLKLLTGVSNLGMIAGHDSVEHPARSVYELHLEDEIFRLREKQSERMACMILRRSELEIYHPLPTWSYRDVDSQITLFDKASLASRKRLLLAADIVTHLGQFDSTWNCEPTPAGQDEWFEIIEVLQREGLWTPERESAARAQRERWREGLVPPPMGEPGGRGPEQGWAEELERIHREHFMSRA